VNETAMRRSSNMLFWRQLYRPCKVESLTPARPLRQTRTYFPVHGVCISTHYNIRSLANSVPPFVAISARSGTGGSESRESIHLLIGADLYGSLLTGNLRQGPLGTPTAQRTALGWIISGPTGLRAMWT